MITASRTTYTEAQQDANWDNLSPKQRAYFNRLADGDPERTGQAFFEDEVPIDIQDDPAGLDIYLNGGTVTVPVDVHNRGRAGVTSTTRQVEIEDRDWSHDVSKANGGSDSADNGRFESASTNRSRGADNSTTAEQADADKQSASDADDINDRVDSEQLIDQAALGLTGGSLICDAAEFAFEGVLPIAMGLTAASKLDDAGFGKGAVIGGGVATSLIVLTPPGQLAAGAYLTWKLAKFGIKTVRKLSN